MYYAGSVSLGIIRHLFCQCIVFSFCTSIFIRRVNRVTCLGWNLLCVGCSKLLGGKRVCSEWRFVYYGLIYRFILTASPLARYCSRNFITRHMLMNGKGESCHFSFHLTTTLFAQWFEGVRVVGSISALSQISVDQTCICAGFGCLRQLHCF